MREKTVQVNVRGDLLTVKRLLSLQMLLDLLEVLAIRKRLGSSGRRSSRTELMRSIMKTEDRRRRTTR